MLLIDLRSLALALAVVLLAILVNLVGRKVLKLGEVIVVGWLLGSALTLSWLILAWCDEFVERTLFHMQEKKTGFYLWLVLLIGLFILSFTALLEEILKGL